MKKIVLLELLILTTAVTFAAAETADTVGLNGRIYTVNSEQPWATAIAIKGTDIVYVGDDEGAKAFIGKNTTVGDIKGRLVLPGLVSGHEHPLMTAAVATALYIEYSEDKDKMLQAVADYIKEKPDAPRWSFGGSYEGRIEIYREDIDKVRLSTGHSSMVHPDDQPRYAKLNVTCNIFAAKNSVPDPTWTARFGPERVK